MGIPSQCTHLSISNLKLTLFVGPIRHHIGKRLIGPPRTHHLKQKWKTMSYSKINQRIGSIVNIHAWDSKLGAHPIVSNLNDVL